MSSATITDQSPGGRSGSAEAGVTLSGTKAGVEQGRILIDLSTVWASRKSQPTGIPRVEFEVASRLIADGATGVIWDPDSQGFLAIDQAIFEGLFLERRRFVDLNDVFLAPPGPNVRWRGAKLAALTVLATLKPLTTRLSGGRNRLVELSARLYGALAPAMPSVDRRRWSWLLGFNSNSWGAAAAVGAFVETLRSRLYASLQGRVLTLNADDVLLLIGASWEFIDLPRLETLKAQRGFKIVSLIYDLVPIRHPEWQPTNDDFTPRFRRAIDRLIKLSDRLAAISEFVARDVERYAREQGFGEISVRPTPLCSEIGDGEGGSPSARLTAAGRRTPAVRQTARPAER